MGLGSGTDQGPGGFWDRGVVVSGTGRGCVLGKQQVDCGTGTDV